MKKERKMKKEEPIKNYVVIYCQFCGFLNLVKEHIFIITVTNIINIINIIITSKYNSINIFNNESQCFSVLNHGRRNTKVNSIIIFLL